MRVEILFLRWLAIIALIAMAVLSLSSRPAQTAQTQYQTFPLIKGGESPSMPLAGIAIDANRREVHAIVAPPDSNPENKDFCIVWKGEDGKLLAATLPRSGALSEAIFEVSTDGKLRRFVPSESVDSAPSSGHAALSESTVRSIIEALPAYSETR